MDKRAGTACNFAEILNLGDVRRALAVARYGSLAAAFEIRWMAKAMTSLLLQRMPVISSARMADHFGSKERTTSALMIARAISSVGTRLCIACSRITR